MTGSRPDGLLTGLAVTFDWYRRKQPADRFQTVPD